jgi:diaminopimelate epimerase
VERNLAAFAARSISNNGTMRFTKMHGCGNDYVLLDGWAQALPDEKALSALSVAISNRHTGVGSDGLIAIAPSQAADARMLMFNSDGSASEMCGNGLRCAAKLAWDNGRVRKPRMRFETGAGILEVALDLDEKGHCSGATVDMGRPRLTPVEVPVRHPGPGPKMEMTIDQQRLIAVGMGNPHAVCFVDDVDHFEVARIGASIERAPAFPRRANVEFVKRLPDEHGQAVLRQRTWERGAGETMACGTGACAAVVAAILDGRITTREAIVRLNGGDLSVAWPADNATVSMSGPAVTICAIDWPEK